jgi:hypothetical protein
MRMLLNASDYGFMGAGSIFLTYATASDFGIRADKNFYISTQGPYPQYIFQSGLLGIGKAPNLCDLDVQQTSTYGFGLATSAQNYSWRIDSSISNSLILGSRTTSTDFLTVTTAGYVGIGTTNPGATYKLQVYGTNTGIRITDGTNSMAMGQWDTTNNRLESSGRPLLITSYTTDIRLGMSGSTTVQITASGMEVGSTGSTNAVNGTVRAAVYARGANNSVSVTALNTEYTLYTYAFSGIITIRDNTAGGSALWLVDPNGGAIQISNNMPGTVLIYYTGGITVLKKTAGSVTTNYSFTGIQN